MKDCIIGPSVFFYYYFFEATLSFLMKWIGFGCALVWPPLSPDWLLLWDYIKNIVLCRSNFRQFDTETSHHRSDCSSDMLCLREIIILTALRLQILPTLKCGRWHQHVEKHLNIHATEKSCYFLFMVNVFWCVNFPFILDLPWTLGINFAGIKDSSIGAAFCSLKL